MRPMMVPLRCKSVLYSRAAPASASASSAISFDARLFSLFVAGCAVLNENNTSEFIADIFSGFDCAGALVFSVFCILVMCLGLG